MSQSTFRKFVNECVNSEGYITLRDNLNRKFNTENDAVVMVTGAKIFLALTKAALLAIKSVALFAGYVYYATKTAAIKGLEAAKVLINSALTAIGKKFQEVNQDFTNKWQDIKQAFANRSSAAKNTAANAKATASVGISNLFTAVANLNKTIVSELKKLTSLIKERTAKTPAAVTVAATSAVAETAAATASSTVKAENTAEVPTDKAVSTVVASQSDSALSEKGEGILNAALDKIDAQKPILTAFDNSVNSSQVLASNAANEEEKSDNGSFVELPRSSLSAA